MSNGVVACRGLTKKYGDIVAVDGLDLSVEAGSVYGFLGRNGAGKTTTLRMLLGLARPSGGSALVLGEDLWASPVTRGRVGYLPETPAFYSWMTGREFLLFSGRLTGVDAADLGSRVDSLLKEVGLKNVPQKVGGYSKGMKQRLGMAQALVGEPEVLFLDEPTSALDPIGRRDFLELILQVSERTTVVFSTHILADVERVCDRIGIIDKGSLVIQASVAELRQNVGGHVFRIQLATDDPGLVAGLATQIETLDFVQEAKTIDSVIEARVDSSEKARVMLPSAIAESGLPLCRFEEKSTDLEEVFIRLVGDDDK